MTGRGRNITSPPRFDPWTIQSVANRYIDSIFPTSNWEQISKKSLHAEERGEISVKSTFGRNLGVWNRPWLTDVLDEVKMKEKMKDDRKCVSSVQRLLKSIN
jgi:hypothetical protein